MNGTIEEHRQSMDGKAIRFDNSGFTLIELLVVVSIISLLVAILVPSLAKARLLTKRVVCMANLRALGTAAALYKSDFDEYVPICWANLESSTYVNPWKSWRMNLLPYTSGVSAFNCAAAKETGTMGEVFHSVDEMAGYEKHGTVNAGSFGVMYQHLLPSCRNVNSHGVIEQCHPMWSLAVSSAPGAAWQDPANSVYIADSYLAKGPVRYPSQSYKDYGSSAIVPPSEKGYFDVGVTRRFADRHCGTNCLFLDGHVANFVTGELDSMVAGEADCVWDVN